MLNVSKGSSLTKTRCVNRNILTANRAMKQMVTAHLATKATNLTERVTVLNSKPAYIPFCQ